MSLKDRCVEVWVRVSTAIVLAGLMVVASALSFAPMAFAQQLDPNDAIAPTSGDDCIALQRQWNARINQLNKETRDCQTQATQRCPAGMTFSCLESIGGWSDLQACGRFETAVFRPCQAKAREALCAVPRASAAFGRCNAEVANNRARERYDVESRAHHEKQAEHQRETVQAGQERQRRYEQEVHVYNENAQAQLRANQQTEETKASSMRSEVERSRRAMEFEQRQYQAQEETRRQQAEAAAKVKKEELAAQQRVQTSEILGSIQQQQQERVRRSLEDSQELIANIPQYKGAAGQAGSSATGSDWKQQMASPSLDDLGAEVDASALAATSLSKGAEQNPPPSEHVANSEQRDGDSGAETISIHRQARPSEVAVESPHYDNPGLEIAAVYASDGVDSAVKNAIIDQQVEHADRLFNDLTGTSLKEDRKAYDMWRTLTAPLRDGVEVATWSKSSGEGSATLPQNIAGATSLVRGFHEYAPTTVPQIKLIQSQFLTSLQTTLTKYLVPSWANVQHLTSALVADGTTAGDSDIPFSNYDCRRDSGANCK